MRKSSFVITGLILALILFFILHFFDVFLMIATWLGVSLIIGVIIIMGLVMIITLLAVPYYLIKQKKEIQEYGNYSLDDVEGKENG